MALTSTAPRGDGDSLEERAWELLRWLRTREEAVPDNERLDLDLAGTTLHIEAKSGELLTRPALPDSVLQMLELCLPVCVPATQGSFVYAHLGQSLDGQIATASGASRYVTSTENLLHMHRLRALADAVIVGAGTVERDDPQLTTRLVPGENPVRVVIDPTLRLSARRRVFRDGQARTIIVCRADARRSAAFDGEAEFVEIAATQPNLEPAAIVQALAHRGLRRLFIEGGGVTVSHFLSTRALDRLHVTVCPLFIGRGRPGLVLPGVDTMEQTLRPSARRFLLGQDVLFDCSFAAPSANMGVRTR